MGVVGLEQDMQDWYGKQPLALGMGYRGCHNLDPSIQVATLLYSNGECVGGWGGRGVTEPCSIALTGTCAWCSGLATSTRSVVRTSRQAVSSTA